MRPLHGGGWLGGHATWLAFIPTAESRGLRRLHWACSRAQLASHLAWSAECDSMLQRQASPSRWRRAGADPRTASPHAWPGTEPPSSQCHVSMSPPLRATTPRRGPGYKSNPLSEDTPAPVSKASSRMCILGRTLQVICVPSAATLIVNSCNCCNFQCDRAEVITSRAAVVAISACAKRPRFSTWRSAAKYGSCRTATDTAPAEPRKRLAIV